MTTKEEMIEIIKAENPTLQVGNDEIGYTQLSNDEYNIVINEWADARIEKEIRIAAEAEAKAAEEAAKQQAFNDAVAAAVAAALAAQQTPATTSEPVVEPTPEPVVEPVVEEPVVTEE
jgi:IMP cyclohydrolase